MKNILVIGATSTIAQAFIRIRATGDARIFLVARNETKLAAVKNDIEVLNGSSVSTYLMDVTDHRKHAEMFSEAKKFLGTVDVILVAHGTLPNQTAGEKNMDIAKRELDVNGTSTSLLCLEAGNLLEKQKTGQLTVITSVSGDRGRQSNYIYGSSKAMVSVLLQGLRNRLNKINVPVLTVKPGFVDTPMTDHLKKGLLFSSPEAIANKIDKAIKKKKNKTIYVPAYWRLIMLIIKSIPGKIFNKLSL